MLESILFALCGKDFPLRHFEIECARKHDDGDKEKGGREDEDRPPPYRCVDAAFELMNVVFGNIFVVEKNFTKSAVYLATPDGCSRFADSTAGGRTSLSRSDR